MYATLINIAKNPNTLILTPSQELANQLFGKLPAHIQVLPIHQYFLNCWTDLELPKYLLSEFQEWQVWQNIIRQSEWGSTLLNIPNTARLVQEAWTLSNEWNLPLLTQSLFFSDEVNQFIRWTEDFKTICSSRHYLSPSCLIPELLSKASDLKTVDSFILVNFDKLNPQTQDFFQILKLPYSFIDLEKKASLKTYAFPDSETELTAIAAWTKERSDQDSASLIHCVIPQLHQHRSQIERIFRKVFNKPIPEVLPIEIKSAYPLAQAPLIKIALLILNLNSFKNPINTLTEILLNPFILDNETELAKYALLDCVLRELNSPEITWTDFLTLAEKQELSNWTEAIQAFLLAKKDNTQRLLKSWAKHFQTLLTILAWPGKRSLNDQEIQEKAAFEKSLEQFSTLDFELEQNHSEKQALSLLEQLLENTLFEIKNKQSLSIKIMDLNTASQLLCDHQWVAGLHEGIWPTMPKLNPFLPSHLQIEKKIPHSSYQNEFVFAEHITKRLRQSSQTVVFSFPENNKEGLLVMSPLLKDFNCESSELLDSHGFRLCEHSEAIQVFNNFDSTELPHRFAPRNDKESVAIPATTQEIKGGSGILKSQSACPFQAFARYRLKAKALPIPTPYLSPLDRGNLLHATLEYFWKHTQNQLVLLSYDENKLFSLIQQSVDSALKSKGHLLQKCPEHWLLVEKQCLESLIVAWLEIEKNRPTFSVAACEIKQAVSLGELNLKLTVDRIDTLNNGDQVVIDYKTGQAKINKNSWSGDRPEEPQLPLYCLALPEVRGSLIAQLRASKPGFTGITAQASGITGVDAIQGNEHAWEQTVEAWSQTLHSLAAEFSQGYAAVEPREPSVCDQCEFSSLCRIREKQA